MAKKVEVAWSSEKLGTINRIFSYIVHGEKGE